MFDLRIYYHERSGGIRYKHTDLLEISGDCARAPKGGSDPGLLRAAMASGHPVVPSVSVDTRKTITHVLAHLWMGIRRQIADDLVQGLCHR